MSSLDHDPLLHEGPEPRTGSTLAPAGGTRSRRRPAASAPEKVSTSARAPRQGHAHRAEVAAPTRRTAKAAGTATAAKAAAATASAKKPAARAPRATTTPAKSTAAKTAATKTAAAKTTPAKTAATKTTPAKTTAAKTTAAKTTAAKTTAAKTTAAKTTPAKTTPAKTTPAKTTPAKTTPAKTTPTKAAPVNAAKAAPAKVAAAEAAPPAPTRRPRPTPYPRKSAPADLAPKAVVDAAEVRDLDDAATLAAAAEESSRTLVEQVVEAPALVVDQLDPAGRTVRGRLGRRVPSVPRRRPALYLAAALVGALGVSAVSGGPAAQAEAADRPSHSMSVAAELGVSSQQTLVAPDGHDADRLAELAASRATRQAEQTAAVQAQQQADAAAAAAIAEAQRPKAVLPVNGARLTSTFGSRWGTLHAGIDLAAPIGTPEYAAMDGVVLEAGPASGFGLAVYIQHANGDVTVYGHMEQILVRPGQVVKAGDEIALLGNRGQSTGPHLHFEVHVGGVTGEKIDPIPWLRDRGIQVG